MAKVLMTVGEYCAHVGVTRMTVHNYLKQKIKMPGIKKVQRTEGGIVILTIEENEIEKIVK